MFARTRYTLTFSLSLALVAACAHDAQDGALLRDSTPLPTQLEATGLHGEEAAALVGRDAAAGIMPIIEGFASAKQNDDLAGLIDRAGAVYGPEAQVFQSQEFIPPELTGPEAFVHTLDTIYTEMGQGQEALVNHQICDIYAYYPADGDDDRVEWIATSYVTLPSAGPLLVTAKFAAAHTDKGWRVTYHDYVDAPAPGEDCAGPQAAKVHAEWLCQVSPDDAECASASR